MLRRVMRAWKEEGEGTVLAQHRCCNASADEEAANHVLGLAGRPKAGRRTKASQSLLVVSVVAPIVAVPWK